MKRRSLLLGGSAVALAGLSATPVAADKATEDRNVAVVRRYFSDFRNARNPEALREIASPDYSYLPDPGIAPGLDAYIARSTNYFEGLARDFVSYEWIEDAVISQSKVVVWRGSEKGQTHDGRLTNVPSVQWFEFTDDGLILHIWGGADRAEIMDEMYG